MIICNICKKEFKLSQFQRHLKRSHPEINHIEYYNDYILDTNENLKCPIKSNTCKLIRKFNSFTLGYNTTCGSKQCSTKYSANKIKIDNIDFTKIIPDKQTLIIFIKEKLKTISLKGIQKHIKSKYQKEYLQIIKLTGYLSLDESINFSERLYHIIHNISGRPICISISSNCTRILKFKNFNDGYQKYCEKCYTKSDDFSKKMINVNKIRDSKQEEIRRKKISNTKLNWSEKKKKEVDDKKKQTLTNNYGDDGLAHKNITEKKKQTHNKRRGVDWATQTEEVQNKRFNTELNLYGGRWMNSDIAKERFDNIWKEKMHNYVLKLVKSRNLELVSDYNKAHTNITLKCKKCQTKFNILWNSFQQGGGVCPTCFPIHSGTSYQEKQISNFVKSLGFKVEENTRKIISPYELDIVIKDKMIAIEYCGLWCHSSGGYIPDKYIVTSNYHQTKLNMCNKQGYKLITIFEDEWVNNPQIVKDRLQYILNKSTGKATRASSCKIINITTKEKDDFLNKYHIQGTDNSSIRLGLQYNDCIISVMTFTKQSIAKGAKLTTKYKWELNRFCNDPSFIIHGGAQKLLKYFQNNYDWNEIISYADRRWSEGNVYNVLGFTLITPLGEPNYWYWGKGIRGRKHRFNFTKSSLKNSTYYEENLTEKEIMTLEKRSWIYDCGHLRYEIKK